MRIPSRLIGIWATIMLLCSTLAAQTTTSTAVDSSAWDRINLTGEQMKPALAATQETEEKKRKIPLWLPIGGGFIAGSATTYLLLRDTDTVPPPPPVMPPMVDTFIINDDSFVLGCLPPATLRPLLNDSGSDLQITAIGPVSGATVTQLGIDALVLTEFGPNDIFSFAVTVTDTLGQTATNVIQVTIERPDITAVADTYTTPFSTLLTGNLLANDMGSNLRISEHTEPTSGTLTLLDNGEFSYVPAPDFTGAITFSYTIVDECEQTAATLVTITVGAPNCSFSVSLTSEAANCGLSDGMINSVVSPSADYTYLWSNGATTPQLDAVPSGNYSLTVSTNGGLCTETASIEVATLPADYLLESTTQAGDCTGGGEITLNLTAPASGNLQVEWQGPLGTQGTTVPSGEVSLSGFTNVLPGSYVITFFAAEAGEICAQSVELIVADDSPPLIAADEQYETPFQTPVSGQVLANEQGLSPELSDFDFPTQGILELDATGAFTYTPEADFAGLVTIPYEVADACGNTAMATLTITVLPPDCAISLMTMINAADCGQTNGSISTTAPSTAVYDYQWSNGASSDQLTDLPAGAYTLTITQYDGLCTEIFEFEVGQNEVDYITELGTVAGNCNGGGDIELMLTSPGDDNLQIDLNGPAGSESFQVAPGEVNLASLINIPAGNYSLSIYPVSTGNGCSQLVSVGVANNTPTPEANPDVFNTPHAMSVSGNVLGNDNGLNIGLTGVSMVTGGTVSVFPDGSFIFNPSPDFAGVGGFSYTIEDECGQQASNVATINVGPPDCNFQIGITVVEPNCGLADGSLIANVSPENEYIYQWSNGGTGSQINGITAGTYSLTVASFGGLCTDEISMMLEERPLNLLLDFQVMPANCTGGGNITLDLLSPNNGGLTGVVSGPAGTETVTLISGLNQLNEQLNLLPGSYSISVYDTAAGPDCSQLVNVVISDNTPGLEAVSDSYSTGLNTPVSGNLLDNDLGLGLSLFNVFNITNGTVDFSADGTFTFTPNDGFTGLANFSYTAQDACGNTDITFVPVVVTPPDCDYTITAVSEEADCGLPFGTLTTMVEPAGEYEYLWSNGATTPDIVELAPGIYDLTVTSNGGFCSQTFQDTIFSTEAFFIDSLSTAPGDCAGNGSIIVHADAPNNGTLTVIINGPNGNDQVEIPSGESDLGDLVNLTSGDYDLIIYPTATGPACQQETFASIGDISPPLIVRNDTFSTPFEINLIENVLANDNGFFLEVVATFGAYNGAVVMSPNGEFIFELNEGATGFAGFSYNATDACDSLQTGEVLIEIGPTTCEYSVNLQVTQPDCGFASGSILAEVDPEIGNYAYEWSTGSTAAGLNDLTPGDYSVTVRDVDDNNCPLSYTVTLEELPANYIQTWAVTTPTCAQMAEVDITLGSNSPGLFTLMVYYPDGSESVHENLIADDYLLSQFGSVMSGLYGLSVYNQNVGESCVDSIGVLVPMQLEPMIDVTNINQPGTGMNDGSFTLLVDGPSTAPYQIFINNMSSGTTAGQPFLIDNLGAGTYDVFVTDANGCMSNIVQVTLVEISPLQIVWQPQPYVPISDVEHPTQGLLTATNVHPQLQLELRSKQRASLLTLAPGGALPLAPEVVAPWWFSYQLRQDFLLGASSLQLLSGPSYRFAPGNGDGRLYLDSRLQWVPADQSRVSWQLVVLLGNDWLLGGGIRYQAW